MSAVFIRLATLSDLPRLADVERSAAQLYKSVGLGHLAEQTLPEHALRSICESGTLWIASCDDTPAGFAAAFKTGHALHLQELSVHGKFQRQGIGTALLAHVVKSSKNMGVAWVTLCTFLEFPWCAPFYKRAGFRILEGAQLSLELQALRQQEINEGLEPPTRVAMRYLID